MKDNNKERRNPLSTLDDLQARINAEINAFRATQLTKLTTPLPSTLTTAAKRQLAEQGGELLPGQTIDPNWGLLYSPLTDADRATVAANGSLAGWSVNLSVGVKTPFDQSK